MTIHVLEWIKEDLENVGDDIRNYTILELKGMLKKYKEIFI